MAGDRHYYVESFDTVRLSGFRIGQSPFAHRYATDQTVFGMYCDRLFPLKITPDENPLDNYWKLRRGVMLYDVPEKPLEIVGPDAGRVLERVLACPNRDARGGAVPLRRCLPRGRHRADGRRGHAPR